MNERTTFLTAAVTAELVASILTWLRSPAGPLCAGFPSLLSYAGQHGWLVAVLWLLAFAAAWLYAGARLVRPRQNLSTKLRLLVWLGLTGVVIDNAVSLYQFSNSSAATMASAATSALMLALAGRTLVYAMVFAAVVGLGRLIGSMQKSTVTPPPRFGRD